jgi:hypothetical protein
VRDRSLSGRRPRGAADKATGLLPDFTFAGDKNASPRYAAAIIDLTQTKRAGPPVVTHKGFLEAATCVRLDIVVHAGKT